jgi:imidazolonepropionase-like amidohydrolase
MLLANARVLTMAKGAPDEPGVSDVRVEDGRIAEVAPSLARRPGEDVIDLSGRYLLPGLIDAHCHITISGGLVEEEVAYDRRVRILRAADNARRSLAGGITTLRDTCGLDDSDVVLRDAIRSGHAEGPRIVACGRMITMTGGHGWFYGQEVDGPDGVRRAVRERIKVRTDWVKFMASGGFAEEGELPASSQLDPDELTAGVAEARKAGRPTCAHAHGARSIKDCLRAGIDSIEHASFLDTEAIDLLLERRAWIVPTFSIYYKMKETGAAHHLPSYVIELVNRSWDRKVASFLDAYRAGVRFAAGSDNGSPAAAHPDITTEIEILSRIGLGPHEAVRAATARGAELLGLEAEIGTIEPGKRADLVVLARNPLRDLAVLRSVDAVLQDGRWRGRGAPAPAPMAAAPA